MYMRGMGDIFQGADVDWGGLTYSPTPSTPYSPPSVVPTSSNGANLDGSAPTVASVLNKPLIGSLTVGGAILVAVAAFLILNAKKG